MPTPSSLLRPFQSNVRRVQPSTADDAPPAVSLLGGASRPDEEFERLTRGFYADLSPAEQDARLGKIAKFEHAADGYRLIERALEETGPGKFQYLLLSLTAFGHFVEATEACLLGLMLPVLRQEFASTQDSDLALVGSLMAVGSLLGSLIFGYVSNVLGRRTAYQFSLLLCVAFAFCSSFSKSVTDFAILRMFMGVGLGGNLVSTGTLLLEFTPTRSRATFMNVLGTAFGVGAVFSTGVAWAVIPVLGWRWMIRITAMLALPVLIAVPFLTESPRFYVMRKRYEDAVVAMQYVADVNRRPLPAYLNAHNLQGGAVSVAEEKWTTVVAAIGSGLWRWKWTLIPLVGVWFTHAFAAGITMFIPMVVSELHPENADAKFQVAFTMAFGGLVGSSTMIFTSYYCGRLLQLKLGMLLTGLVCFLLGLKPSSSDYITAMGFFFVMLGQAPYSMLYVYSPEAFPTEIRTVAFAICHVAHRTAMIAAPFAVTALRAAGSSFEISCVVFGSMFLLSTLISLALRTETKGRGMVEDDDFFKQEAERLAHRDERHQEETTRLLTQTTSEARRRKL